MRVTGISAEDVRRIVGRTSVALWDGNVKAEITDLGVGPRTGPRCSFVLRVHDSKATGARRSGSGRRTIAACWHAHRSVLATLFQMHPSARIRTALADYRGEEGFYEEFGPTFYKNVGSSVQPIMFGDLCECEGPYEHPYSATPRPRQPQQYSGPDVSRVSAIADEEIAAWDEILRNAQTKKSRVSS